MNRNTAASLLTLASALSLVACASGRPRPGSFAEHGDRPPPPMLFVSPAGMPYRDGSPENPPHGRWFAEVDTNRDGALDREEFRQDFASAFAAFDLDASGDISGSEIMRYETDTFPEISSGGAGGGGQGRPSRSAGGGPPSGERGGPGGGRGGGGPSGQGGGQRPEQSSRQSGNAPVTVGGAARFGLLPIHHPLAQADRNIDRRITPEEFEAAANLRFDLLDADHDGRLVRAQLEEMLPHRPPPRR